MKIQLLRPWHEYSKGAIIEPPGALRSLLIESGIARAVSETDKPAAAEGESKHGVRPDPKQRPKRRARRTRRG